MSESPRFVRANDVRIVLTLRYKVSGVHAKFTDKTDRFPRASTILEVDFADAGPTANAVVGSQSSPGRASIYVTFQS